MSELLSIIDHDGNELAITTANHYRWQFPLGGEGEREEPAKIERLLRKRPHRLVGSLTDPLPLTLNLGVIGDTRALLLSRLNDLLWYTDPERGTFTIKRTASSGTVYYITAVRERYARDDNALARGGPIMPVTIECQAPDPAWYDLTPVVVSGQFDGPTPVMVSCPNSNMGTYVEITLSGEAVDPKWTFAGGRYAAFTGEVPTGETLYVDCRPDSDTWGATLYPSGTVWTGRRTEFAEFTELPAGTTALTGECATGEGWWWVRFVQYYKVPY